MNKNKIYVFNPLNEDFSVKMALNDGTQEEFTIKAKEVAKFEEHVAEHLKKHLADRIFDVRGSYKKEREPQIEKFYEEMEVI